MTPDPLDLSVDLDSSDPTWRDEAKAIAINTVSLMTKMPDAGLIEFFRLLHALKEHCWQQIEKRGGSPVDFL